MQIKSNGIMLEGEITGPEDGPVMILIRGLGTQLVDWPAEFIQGFANLGYRTVTFDNRDAGLSQKLPTAEKNNSAGEILAVIRAGHTPKPAYSLDGMALDVIGLMDAMAIDKAHILGISMGGAIAQILAIEHTDRLQSACIVMTAAKIGGPGLLESMLVYPRTMAEAQDELVQVHADWGSPGYPLDEPAIRAQAAVNWNRCSDPDGSNRQAIATLSASDRRAGLKTVDLPCLVIHGADDGLIPPDMGREIASLIPGPRLEIIDGMGHAITPLLSPIIVNMVNGFIAQNG